MMELENGAMTQTDEAGFGIACLIANLEGLLNLPLCEDLSTSLESLDKRVGPHEIRTQTTTVLPTGNPTWKSLAWRTCRLIHGRASGPMTNTMFAELLPSGEKATMNDLLALADNLAAYFSILNLPPLPKVLSVDIICQRIFYMAGKRGYRLAEVPKTIRDVYTKGVGIITAMEVAQAMRLRRPPPPGRPGPDRGMKGCCECHRKPEVVKKQVLRPLRWPTLAWWRRKAVENDSLSSSETD